MSAFTALVITPTGERKLAQIPHNAMQQVRVMHDLVGGYLEAVYLRTDPEMVMWVNEDGHSLNLAPNPLATLLIGSAQIVLGTVVLTGRNDPELADIPPQWLEELAGIEFVTGVEQE